MTDEPKIFEELLRSLKEPLWPRLPRRLPDTDEIRRDLAQAHDLHRYHPTPCLRCGGSFLLRGPGYYARYCSRECQQADRNGRRAEQREQERQRRDREPIMCAQCGNPVPPERSTRRYCSDACRQRAYRQRARVKPDDRRVIGVRDA
jgi:hypothetical protein